MALDEGQAIKGSKVLVVGAGGIGCELLKTLALSGFEDIHVVDMDTIEVSNLNRQFLFRQWHVGQSKAKIARDAILKFRPNINIIPYHANIKDKAFSVDFFTQFNVVMNGLDNLDARRHVNRLCLAADVPLIESGTTGFLGQVAVHVKTKTECYECQPKPTPKTYPVCTITSTPSKFVHCVVWAKDLLFAKIFGDRNRENDLSFSFGSAVRPSEHTEDPLERRLGENLDDYCGRIYDHVFGYNVETILANQKMWKGRNQPRPIYMKEILLNQQFVENGFSVHTWKRKSSSFSAMTLLGLCNPQEVWSLFKNTQIFLASMKLFMEMRNEEIGSIIFDKEDQLAVEFVTAAANIRASSFGIPLHSLFEVKGIAGNIVHAVATTNAIVAGLIAVEAIKVLQNDASNYRMTYCVEHPMKNMLLMPAQPFDPNPSCYACSDTPVLLETNTAHIKLQDFLDKIVRGKFGMIEPTVMVGASLLYEAGEDLDNELVTNYAANLGKVLAELPTPVLSGTIVNVEDFHQEFSCSIVIKHREEFGDENTDGFALVGWDAPTAEKEKQKDEDAPSKTLVTAGGLSIVEENLSAVETIQTDGTIAAVGSKRKHFDENNSIPVSHKDVDEDDDVIAVEDPEILKRQRTETQRFS